MKTVTDRKQRRRYGFTIIELLVVISIIAIIATFAIGAAMKSVRQSREKRVTATIQILQMALMSYRAQENKWPFDLSDLEHDNNSDYYSAAGENNAVVFKKLLSSDTKYLDGSGLYTAINGRMTVKKARENGLTSIPIGYPDPSNQDTFKYFTVKYYPLTDRVVVSKP